MDFTPLLITFGLIAIAELGDKTQLTVIALSAGYDKIKVFTGVILAFILVTGLGILVGESLFLYVSPDVIKIIVGLMFIAFGVWIIFSKTGCETEGKKIIIQSVILNFFNDNSCGDGR